MGKLNKIETKDYERLETSFWIFIVFFMFTLPLKIWLFTFEFSPSTSSILFTKNYFLHLPHIKHIKFKLFPIQLFYLGLILVNGSNI